MTALRVRAKRRRSQVYIPSPPMFRVSWDVLKDHAASDGMIWISKQLWSGTGAAGVSGPYLAWAPGRHSFKNTVQRLGAQQVKMAQTRALTAARIDLAGADTVEEVYSGGDGDAASSELAGAQPSFASRKDYISPSPLEAVLAGGADSATQQNVAASFGLPMSIFEKSRSRTR